MSWTASVSEAQPAAPVAATFAEPQIAPQQYVQQPFTPAAPAGSGLALTRRQLREQSEQLALAASTPQQADAGVIARSAHAAEPLPVIETPATPPFVEPVALDTSAAHAEAAALIAAAIASPEPVAAPAPAAPFDWSPNAVMPARTETPAAPVEAAPEPVAAPVVQAAPVPVPVPVPVAVAPEPVAPVAAAVAVAPAAPLPVVTAAEAVPEAPLSNYAALAALFGSVDSQTPEPTWEDEKAKAPAVVQFDYAASFTSGSSGTPGTPGYAPFGGATSAVLPQAALTRTPLSANTGAVWIMAIFPLIQVAIGWVLFSYLAVDVEGPARYAYLGGMFVLFMVLAGADRKALTANGYDRVPSLLWAIVPLFYFIARIVRTGVRSIAPLLVWILSQVALAVAIFLLLMPLIGAMTAEPPADTAVEQPTSSVLTETQKAALLTVDGATEYARTSLVTQGILAEALTCPAFPSTEVGASIVCTFTEDGEAMEYTLTLDNVVVAP